MTDSPSEAQSSVQGMIEPDLKKVMQDARQTLVSGGLGDVAERAWAQLTADLGTPIIVVIGEVKRGKSSLINALLGHPDVAPVDVDIATSAFIRFVPVSDSARERDTALLFAGGRREAITFTDLRDWVTVAGRHVVDSAADELPIGAEVAISGRLLPHVAVVDTPGVGGLRPSHVHLATEATTTASILLMICDASATITEPELRFLESVAGEVESVVIAVTKIDKNVRHWRSIMAENRRLLCEYAPRFADAPMVGVSSRNAIAALQMDPGERRESALGASGLPELVDCLGKICSADERLPITNGLRITKTGLELVANQLAAQRSAIAGGPTAVKELTAEKERLKALREEWEGGWRDYLFRDLNTLQRNTLGTLDRKIDELRTRWRRQIEDASMDVLRRSPQLFVADMTADLQKLVGEVSSEYVDAVAALTERLKLEADISIESLSAPITRSASPGERGEGALDPQMLMIGVMGTSTLGGALVAVLGITAVGLAVPITLGIGGAWMAVNFGFRAVKMGRQRLQQWLNETAVAVQRDVTREIQERTDYIRPTIINEYKQQLSDSMGELQKLIASAIKAEKASKAEQEDALAEIDTRSKAVAATIAAVDAQLARYAAGRSNS
jgi:GTP-binding protein EngB required for normal cell division